MSDATHPDATHLADRAVLRLSGEDVRGFLQGLVTQDLAAVAPGAPQWSGLLTPQGKALFDFLLWADGDDVLIDCEAAQADALVRRLSLYRLRRAIVIARDPALGVHWSLAPAADAAADPRHPKLGWRWLGAPTGEDASPAWRAHRLALGVVEGAEELGQDATLWLEANARELNGVSFTKGCYVGQENTARMHHRAKVSRRLLVTPLAEPGARTRVSYPDLGVMVELRRLDALGDAKLPNWVEES
ncbi:folate-binding protein [Sphingomonas sp. S1-29]|uniref:CAF17-like 4Fe-4S cluster assembly/insertion protein YgfZ n=1 Tax=Sphingomonas sp. S1-29 TaxID=2991074 RepID=UPI00223F07A2|nr:folate-binding protein [Sphingomonas sp. S1-29]UZK70449.1 folate-binding protein [Sphingomonas sp. S1-29]